MEEKTTLTAKPALVISLKSVATDLSVKGFEVTFNVEFICFKKLLQRYFIESDLTNKHFIKIMVEFGS
jgi:hypothetical protein